MIISTALKEDIGELTDLWQTCFGDDDDYIGVFMRSRFVPEHTLIGREDGKICSALYLLDGKVRIAGEAFDAAYLYAACTHPDFSLARIYGRTASLRRVAVPRFGT